MVLICNSISFRIVFRVMDASENLQQNRGFRLNRKKTSSYLRKNQTPAERLLWSRLRGKQIRGLRFRRQHPVLSYIVDFFCASRKLVIEVDGSIHDFKDEADILRQHQLEISGYKVIRFTNEVVIKDIKLVIDEIVRATQDQESR